MKKIQIANLGVNYIDSRVHTGSTNNTENMRPQTKPNNFKRSSSKFLFQVLDIISNILFSNSKEESRRLATKKSFLISLI